MEQLKQKAVKIHDGMKVVFPQFTRAGVFVRSKGPRQRYNLKAIISHVPAKRFSYQNDVYAFVDEHGDLYAIPGLPEVYSTLINNGYKTSNFFVPFGWYEEPVDSELSAKWNALKHEYNVSRSKPLEDRH